MMAFPRVRDDHVHHVEVVSADEPTQIRVDKELAGRHSLGKSRYSFR
jgi:hypothetical protein